MWRFGAWVALGVTCVACSSPDSGAAFGGQGGNGVGGFGAGGNGVGGDGSGGTPGITTSSKMDVVLVVDNSAFMTDMQEQLANSIPALIGSITAPASKITDLHIGVITTSLGSNGTSTCTLTNTTSPVRAEQYDDAGHLLGTRPRAASVGVTNGFVSWTAGMSTTDVVTKAQGLVKAAGEFGCGLEAQLESLYRFLADPNPPQSVTTGPCPADATKTCEIVTGTDSTLLAERAAFLRPDSSVVAILLSNENDCSISREGHAFNAARVDVVLPKASTPCAADPNDPCCYSCGSAPATCPPDPGCATPADPNFDRVNIRCFDQKRRFGEDFLYPIGRYINALTKPNLCPARADLDSAQCAGAGVVPNPLFTGPPGGLPRSASLVHLLGIVGVPWQTLQNKGSADLVYPTGAEMAAANAWPAIYVDSSTNPTAKPLDPLMIESITARAGVTPGTGEALAPPTAGYLANSVNGHEMTLPNLDDLQFACIFKLPQYRDCAAASASTADPRPNCDCISGSNVPDNPLCQDTTGSYGNFQYFNKAYPGLRELGVIRALGNRGAAASICARNLGDSGKQDYAFVPAMSVLARELGL